MIPPLLAKTQSIPDEVGGEACSLLILKTVGGLSTQFHEKIVALVLEAEGARDNPREDALSPILRR